VWVCSNLGYPHTPDEAIASCTAALEAPGGADNATIADI
jgi:GTP cyclohydrolase III